jgi:hypothetical protein
VSAQHKLTEVIHDLHAWTALCTCRKWATVKPSEAAVKRAHAEHVREVAGK